MMTEMNNWLSWPYFHPLLSGPHACSCPESQVFALNSVSPTTTPHCRGWVFPRPGLALQGWLGQYLPCTSRGKPQASFRILKLHKL